MKTIGLVIVWVGLAMGSAVADEPQTLIEGTWVCQTPAAYDQAAEAKGQGKDQGNVKLKQQLLEKKLCMVINEDHLDDLMAPYVKVLDRQEGKVKVTFSVEFYKRIQFLHRKITRVTYAGWTGAENLKNYFQ